jgi:hypothetical protein
MSGQPGQLKPAVAPSDDVPDTFPENGTSPIGYLSGANQTGTFDRAASSAPLTVQNLTTHVLRMKGLPEADIGAAINDPAKMQNLLNQLYGRRPMKAPGDASGGFGNQVGQTMSAGRPGQAPLPAAATPDDHPPFGWAGLPPLLR